MKIDEIGLEGTFSINKLDGEETANSEIKKPRVVLTVKFSAEPAFLDRYMEGHNSGADPSAVFWRDYGPAPEAEVPAGEVVTPMNRFLRYMWLDHIRLVVSENAKYTVKLQMKRPKGIDSDNFMGYREFLVDGAMLKKLHASAIANACIVTGQFLCYPDEGYVRELGELTLQSEVRISIWNGTRDLFEQSPPTGAAEKSHEPESEESDAEGEPALAVE